MEQRSARDTGRMEEPQFSWQGRLQQNQSRCTLTHALQVASSLRKSHLASPLSGHCYHDSALVPVGVAHCFTDFVSCLSQQLLGVLGVSVHVPIVGPLGVVESV